MCLLEVYLISGRQRISGTFCSTGPAPGVLVEHAGAAAAVQAEIGKVVAVAANVAVASNQGNVSIRLWPGS